jgi:hypothetical protein
MTAWWLKRLASCGTRPRRLSGYGRSGPLVDHSRRVGILSGDPDQVTLARPNVGPLSSIWFALRKPRAHQNSEFRHAFRLLNELALERHQVGRCA